jgi:hypothetical protein
LVGSFHHGTWAGAAVAVAMGVLPIQALAVRPLSMARRLGHCRKAARDAGGWQLGR